MFANHLSVNGILEYVHDAVIVVDCEKLITFWNAAAERIYGWHNDEVIGLSVSEIIPTLNYIDLDISSDVAAATLLDQGAWQGKVVQQHRDGHLLTIDASVRLQRDADGITHGMIAVYRDITERSRYAAHAYLNEAQLVAHTEGNAAPSVVWQTTGERAAK